MLVETSLVDTFLKIWKDKWALLCPSAVTSRKIPCNIFFFSELWLGKTMVAYTKPRQRKKEESERLGGKRDQIKFINIGQMSFHCIYSLHLVNNVAKTKTMCIAAGPPGNMQLILIRGEDVENMVLD